MNSELLDEYQRSNGARSKLVNNDTMNWMRKRCFNQAPLNYLWYPEDIQNSKEVRSMFQDLVQAANEVNGIQPPIKKQPLNAQQQKIMMSAIAPWENSRSPGGGKDHQLNGDSKHHEQSQFPAGKTGKGNQQAEPERKNSDILKFSDLEKILRVGDCKVPKAELYDILKKVDFDGDQVLGENEFYRLMLSKTVQEKFFQLVSKKRVVSNYELKNMAVKNLQIKEEDPYLERKTVLMKARIKKNDLQQIGIQPQIYQNTRSNKFEKETSKEPHGKTVDVISTYQVNGKETRGKPDLTKPLSQNRQLSQNSLGMMTNNAQSSISPQKREKYDHSKNLDNTPPQSKTVKINKINFNDRNIIKRSESVKPYDSQPDLSPPLPVKQSKDFQNILNSIHFKYKRNQKIQKYEQLQKEKNHDSIEKFMILTDVLNIEDNNVTQISEVNSTILNQQSSIMERSRTQNRSSYIDYGVGNNDGTYTTSNDLLKELTSEYDKEQSIQDLNRVNSLLQSKNESPQGKSSVITRDKSNNISILNQSTFGITNLDNNPTNSKNVKRLEDLVVEEQKAGQSKQRQNHKESSKPSNRYRPASNNQSNQGEVDLYQNSSNNTSNMYRQVSNDFNPPSRNINMQQSQSIKRELTPENLQLIRILNSTSHDDYRNEILNKPYLFVPKTADLQQSDASETATINNDMEAMKQEMRIVVNRAQFKAKQEMSFISKQIESTLSQQNSIISLSNREYMYPTLTNDLTIQQEDEKYNNAVMFPRISRGRSKISHIGFSQNFQESGEENDQSRVVLPQINQKQRYNSYHNQQTAGSRDYKGQPMGETGSTRGEISQYLDNMIRKSTQKTMPMRDFSKVIINDNSVSSDLLLQEEIQSTQITQKHAAQKIDKNQKNQFSAHRYQSSDEEDEQGNQII